MAAQGPLRDRTHGVVDQRAARLPVGRLVQPPAPLLVERLVRHVARDPVLVQAGVQVGVAVWPAWIAGSRLLRTTC